MERSLVAAIDALGPRARIGSSILGAMLDARASVPLKILSAAATDIGRRKHNEDTVLLRPDLNLYLLADGAGGHNAGNVASALATTSIAHYFETTHNDALDKPKVDELGLSTTARRLACAMHRANHDIVHIAKTSNNYQGMGTTIVAAFLDPFVGALHVGHVGDSRCYRLRDGRFEQLTDDHSLLNDILELRPDLDNAVLAKLPRNVVTRALGMEEKLRVAVRGHQVIAADKYLLCSDGLTSALDDDEIADVMRVAKNPEEAVKLLIDMATEAGADDNVATIVLSCELSPGVSQFPRRISELPRAKKTRTPMPMHAINEASSPEIVIVGVETIDDDFGGQIHVVPTETSSPNLLDALGSFVAPLRPQRPPRPPAIPMVPTTSTPPAQPPPRRTSSSHMPIAPPALRVGPSSRPSPPSPPSSRPSPPRPSTTPKSPCARCGRAMENDVLVCPVCGTPRDVKR